MNKFIDKHELKNKSEVSYYEFEMINHTRQRLILVLDLLGFKHFTNAEQLELT